MFATLRNERGLTLIEILAAVLALGLLVTAFAAISNYLSNTSERDSVRSEALRIAEQKMADIRKNIPTTPPGIPEVGMLNDQYVTGNFRITVNETAFADTNAGNYSRLAGMDSHISLQGEVILFETGTGQYVPRLVTVTVSWGEAK